MSSFSVQAVTHPHANARWVSHNWIYYRVDFSSILCNSGTRSIFCTVSPIQQHIHSNNLCLQIITQVASTNIIVHPRGHPRGVKRSRPTDTARNRSRPTDNARKRSPPTDTARINTAMTTMNTIPSFLRKFSPYIGFPPPPSSYNMFGTEPSPFMRPLHLAYTRSLFNPGHNVHPCVGAMTKLNTMLSTNALFGRTPHVGASPSFGAPRTHVCPNCTATPFSLVMMRIFLRMMLFQPLCWLSWSEDY